MCSNKDYIGDRYLSEKIKGVVERHNCDKTHIKNISYLIF